MINPIINMVAIAKAKQNKNICSKSSDDENCETCNGKGCSMLGVDCPDCNGTGIKPKEEND